MKIFITSFLQIFFVSVNTVLLARGLVVGVFFAAFTISFIWCFNVSKVSVASMRQKVVYSLGAACGSVCGLLFTNFILNCKF